jgi:DNA-binding HxlR family transcriptional regulator
LLILRDVIFFDAKTYSDFVRRPEQIPTNLLAQRLKKLVEDGLLEKIPYQNNPIRYEYIATEKCNTVKPILTAMKKFGDEHFLKA